MPKSVIRSIRFLAVLCALAMIITKELHPIFVGAFLGLFLLGLLIEKKKSVTRFLGKAQPYLAFLSFLIAIFDFTSISRSFLLAIAHFLITLQGLRLLTLRTVRDGLGSILLSSLMILSASTLSIEWTFFVFLSLFLPLAIWCLLLLNILMENQLNTVARKPEISDQTLSLVKAGLSDEGFIEEKNGAWVRMLPVLRKATAVAFFVAMGCCAFVFAVFPRFNFRGFRGQFLQPVHKSGFTNAVDLEKGGRIFLDRSVAMRIEMAEKDRSFWSGYVRGTTLDYFDGKIWSHANKELPRPIYLSRGAVVLPHKPSRNDRILTQNIFLESMDSPVLFAAPVPISFKLDRPFLMLGEDDSVERGRGDTWRIRYETVSIIPVGDKRQLPYQRGGFSSPFFTELPSSFNSEPFRTLALELSRSAPTTLKKAELLEQYLRSQFSYSLDLSSLTGDKLLEKFLFEQKKGNCEYFASALCVLLRTLGIPSRMVAGFYAHEWNSRGQYYVVRMSDAHAWVEAYVDGTGWIQLDPTPRIFADSENERTWLQKMQELADLMNLKWNRYILSYDIERQVQILQSMNEHSHQVALRFDILSRHLRSLFGGLSFAAEPSTSASSFSFRTLLFFIAFVLLAGLTFVWIRRGIKKKNPVWFYDRILRFIEKKGGEKPESSTPFEFVLKLKETLGDFLPDILFLLEEYYRRRFNPASPPSQESDNRVRQALKNLKA